MADGSCNQTSWKSDPRIVIKSRVVSEVKEEERKKN